MMQKRDTGERLSFVNTLVAEGASAAGLLAEVVVFAVALAALVLTVVNLGT